MRVARSKLKQSDVIHRGGRFHSGNGKTAKGPTPPHGNPRYTFPVATRSIDTNSTATTVSNTTTETVVIDVDLPALTIRSKGATRLAAAGTIFNSAAASGTVTYRVKVDDGGGDTTVLATSGIVCSTSTGTRSWVLDAVMFGNGNSIQTHWGVYELSEASTGNMPPVATSVVGYSTSGIDETNAINMTVTAQMSAASTGFTVVRESAILEAVT